MTKTCVLVVDDEPIGREVMAENLMDEGYEVVEADSGESAWTAIDATPQRFDAILLDRLMPDMDGIEILRRVKNRPEMMSVPVIMQTGMAADADVLEGLKAGAYYYLTKPFAAETLLAIVAAAVRDYRSHLALEEEVKRQEELAKKRELGPGEHSYKFVADGQWLADGRTFIAGWNDRCRC